MQINSSNAVQGIYQAQQKLNQNAAEISSKEMAVGKADFIKPQAEILAASQQYTSSVKAFRTENENLGTLLDTQA